MMTARRRINVGVFLAVLLTAASASLLAVATETTHECYVPLRISGAGTSVVNGQAFFAGFADGRPFYVGRDVRVEWDSGTRSWIIYDTSGVGDVAVYTSNDNEPTPPDRGWTISGGAAPAPHLSGGEPCPLIEPTGVDGGFLHRGLDLEEGETPPLAGARILSAIYTIGETVTGSCHILDPDSGRYVFSYVHAYVYSIDVDATPESIRIVTHWIAPHDWDTREYVIEWDTADQAPGYYDLRLSFEGGGSATMRIQLVEPED